MNYLDDAIRAENALAMSANIQGSFQMSGSTFNQLTNGMRTVGLISDTQSQSLRKISNALNLIIGGMALHTAYQSFLAGYRARETVKATAETTAHTTMQNWAGIAIATATAVSVTTVIIAANALSDPVQRGNIMSSIREIVG